MDRFLKSRGFCLVDLVAYRYSRAGLPTIFTMDQPAQTIGGPPTMGDAIYVRDPVGFGEDWHGGPLSAVKLLKLAAIAELVGTPDVAAELLLHYRERLAPHVDVEACLDGLARANAPSFARHAGLLAAFRANVKRFYYSANVIHRVRTAIKNRL